MPRWGGLGPGRRGRRARKSEAQQWAGDDLPAQSDLGLRTVLRRDVSFYLGSGQSHHLWSCFKEASSVLRDSQCALVSQSWNINFEVQIYFVKEV